MNVNALKYFSNEMEKVAILDPLTIIFAGMGVQDAVRKSKDIQRKFIQGKIKTSTQLKPSGAYIFEPGKYKRGT